MKPIPPGAPPAPAAARAAASFAAICAVTLLAYAPSFDSPFQFDDYGHIVGNPVMAHPSVQAVVSFGRARLVPFATLVGNYQWGGEEPFGYHVVNFAIHLLATFAVFRLALALCRSPRLRGSRLADEPLVFAAAAALLFACHPIQIQAVTYVVQRMSSMAAMFYVGSVLLYVRARNAELGLGPGRAGIAYAGSALLAIGAFFSKENAASLPVAILLAELAFFPGEGRARRLVRLAPFAVLVLLIPVMWKLFGRRPGLPQPADASLAEQTQDLLNMLVFRANRGGDVSSLEYLYTQATVIPRYLKLVVLPFGFSIDHDLPAARAFSGTVAAGFVFLGALLAGGLYALRRAPIAGFAVLWLFVTLSVESSLLPIRDVMVEHRMYLPMAGLALGAGWLFAAALRSRRMPTLVGAGAAAVLLVFLTFARNQIWQSPLALWQDALAKFPENARAHANVGTALHHLGRLDEAIRSYCKALELDPRQGYAKVNLETALEEQIEERAEAGEELVAVIGPDGSFRMADPDPCKPEDAAEKKGSSPDTPR